MNTAPLPSPSRDSLTGAVRSFWEQGACGTDVAITGDLKPFSAEWFARIEENRYAMEPEIHAVAQFSRHRGKKILEIGVGAGTDHLQWARAGCQCFGVDLTDTAIQTTKTNLSLNGLESQLQRLSAETLPFPEASFDIVWSWGVIHHAENPQKVVNEIYRVLKPGGTFIGMMYKRWSATLLRVWVRHALLAGRPWRSLADVTWHHFESIGTKAYTLAELQRMFSTFDVELTPFVTPYDRRRLPAGIGRHLPSSLGMFVAIRATKPL